MVREVYVAFIVATIFCQTHVETSTQTPHFMKKRSEYPEAWEEPIQEEDFTQIGNFGNNTNWHNVKVNLNKTLEQQTHLEEFHDYSAYTRAKVRNIMLEKIIDDMKEVVDHKELVKTDDDVQKLCKRLEELAHEYTKPIYKGFYDIIASSFIYMTQYFSLDDKYFCSQETKHNSMKQIGRLE